MEKNLIEIGSSHGLIWADQQGNVVKMETCFTEGDHDCDDCHDDPQGHAIHNITKFDLDEYRKYYQLEADAVIECSDILDIGYWLANGTYVEAVEEHRDGSCFE